jgi:hypothetical protein
MMYKKSKKAISQGSRRLDVATGFEERAIYEGIPSFLEDIGKTEYGDI